MVSWGSCPIRRNRQLGSDRNGRSLPDWYCPRALEEVSRAGCGRLSVHRSFEKSGLEVSILPNRELTRSLDFPVVKSPSPQESIPRAKGCYRQLSVHSGDEAQCSSLAGETDPGLKITSKARCCRHLVCKAKPLRLGTIRPYRTGNRTVAPGRSTPPTAAHVPACVTGEMYSSLAVPAN